MGRPALGEERGYGNRSKIAHKRRTDNYRKKHPEKYKATNKVNNWLRLGKIDKPTSCQRCGDHTTLHAHHHDYDKPLDVEWVCPACHREEHHGSAV